MKFYICLLFVLFGHAFVAAQSVAASFHAAEDPVQYVLDNFESIRTNTPDTALHYLNRVIELTEASTDQARMASAYKYRGIINFYLGNYEEEKRDFLKAINIAEAIDDDGLKGDIYKELSASASRQKELDKSITYGWLAVELCGKAKYYECLASAQRMLGRTYLKLNRRDSADYFLLASYELKLELKDSIGIPYALNDLAELAMLDGQPTAALNYLEESANIREQIGDSTGLAITLNNIGEMILGNGDLPTARTYFERSIVLSKKLRFTPLLQHSLGLLGSIYQQMGDYEAAYHNLQVSKSLNDSLYSVNKAQAISEMEVAYETKKKEQLINSQQTELKLQRLIGVSAVLFLLLLGGFLYYRIYQRRKYEKEINRLEIQQELHQERERISRDLHDNVGANLTRIITDLDLMTPIEQAEKPAPQEAQINDTRAFTQQTIRLLRDTIWALNKDSFNTSEFASKTEAFLRYYLKDLVTWKVEKHITQERQLSSNEVLNLLRILQEGTQNMLKHSDACHFEVQIKNTGSGTRLIIKDDGKGMFPQQDLDDHYGLYNMRQRAQDIGATFELTTDYNKGLTIAVDLPI